jgi:hypothetical protein
VPLHDLGEVIITPPSVSYEPAEAPQKAVKTLTVRLAVWERSWEDNYDLLRAAAQALDTQHATLQWQDAFDVDIVNRPVRVVSHNFPAAGGDGVEATYHQTLELVFQWEEHDLEPNAREATYQRTGAASALNLGRIESVASSYRATRRSPHRSVRSGASGRISLSGYLKTATTAAIDTQRADLQSQLATLKAEIQNASDGRLIYADFNRVVRVEEFEARLDQANGSIRWTLAAGYTDFPNEAGYTLAEYRLSTRQDDATGQVRLRFSGRVDAASEAAAITALNTLRTAQVPAATWQREGAEREPTYFHGDTDGVAFVELTWSEDYVKHSGDVLDWTLNREDGEPLAGGLVETTLTGSVRAKGASEAAAFTTARAKARALGADKEAALATAPGIGNDFSGLTVIATDRRETQTTSQRLTDGAWIVTVSFSYGYRRKGERVYLEVTSETARPAFEAWTESVSGFVVAATHAAAQTQYETLVRAAFNGRALLDERFGKVTEQRVTATAGELQTRWNFSFSVHRDRTTAASERGVQYSVVTREDPVARRQVTSVSGTIADTGRDAALAYIRDVFLPGLGLSGNQTELTLESDHARGRNAQGTALVGGALGSDTFFRGRFSAAYEAKLGGDTGLLQTALTVSTRHAITRRVYHAIPTGLSIKQEVGIEPGQRSVRGTAVATNAAAALAWAQTQRAAFIDLDHEGAPEITYDYEFPVAVEGDVGAENFLAVRLTFSFTCTLLSETLASP